MKTRTKFHAIAIAAIIAVISILYSVLGPQQSTAVVANTSGKAIEIYSATWGQECNTAIAEALADRALTPLPQDATNIPTLTPVTPNNVLTAVAAACNGKPACELPANVEALGTDPMTACFKSLVVSYRCYSFDRLTTLTIGQGEALTIDCLQPNTTNAVDNTAH